MELNESVINKIIKETIDEYLNETEVKQFTPYSKEQAAINKMGIGRMGNPSYDRANKAPTAAKSIKYHSYNDWFKNYKPKGISWADYQKMEI